MEKRVQLDCERIFFLTIRYIDDNIISRYSIDIEQSNDTHYDFTVAEFEKMAKILEKMYQSTDVSENLSQFIKRSGSVIEVEMNLMKLLRDNNIKYMIFSY